GTTMAVIADDNDPGRSTLAQVNYFVSNGGGKVVYSQANIAPPPAVTGDYTPYATAIMSSDGGKPPTMVYLLNSYANMIGMATKLRELGFKGTIIDPSVLYDPSAV